MKNHITINTLSKVKSNEFDTYILKKPESKFICTVVHTYYQQQKYIPSQKWK